jgi:hypothetical protein
MVNELVANIFETARVGTNGGQGFTWPKYLDHVPDYFWQGVTQP